MVLNVGETPPTLIPINLKTQLFLSCLAFRPHWYGVFEHLKRNVLKTLSRVDKFENAAILDWLRAPTASE